MSRLSQCRKALVSVQRVLDSFVPTLTKYSGFALLGYAVFVDHGHNPALIPAATGMILFKTVYGSGGKE